MIPIDQCNEIETFKEVLSGGTAAIFMSGPPGRPKWRDRTKTQLLTFLNSFCCSEFVKVKLIFGAAGGSLEVIYCGFRGLLCHPGSLLQIKNRGQRIDSAPGPCLGPHGQGHRLFLAFASHLHWHAGAGPVLCGTGGATVQSAECSAGGSNGI
jgi:hypothetical protein